jgi:patatin-related protein
MTGKTKVAESAPDGDQDEPKIQTQREVRLALIMYGGVSLAIYMNGVAQELWHLVRSTAPKSLRSNGSNDNDLFTPLVPTSELSGTEVVYRKIGRALASLADDPMAPVARPGREKDVTTRFVIDILSGTSAGGINAVFLAKALANNQQIEQLRNLWMDEGNISVLLNDAKSEVKGITLEQPPESLLNSGRMYFKLLEAFDAMEDTNRNPLGDSASPYVQELDLWVTSTDLRGVTLPLSIANGIAYERRYRSVWHFVYGTEEASGGDRNDFTGKNDPMLAFAARCTSAFPFAFKPMEFGDMREALALRHGYPRVNLDDVENGPWRPFYGSYFPPSNENISTVPLPEEQIPFIDRPFADGGALDNKPFTWATETLLRRRADVPVDRKLIYIEPDPGHPETEMTKRGRPNVLQNFLLQGNNLPRQETIRQDLQAVLDRNRTIVRIDRVLQGLADRLLPASEPPNKELGRVTVEAGRDWSLRWLDEPTIGPDYDSAEGGYSRLKVAAVTDDLSSLMTSLSGFDEDSDEFLAIGYLVRTWRDHRYDYQPGRDQLTNVPFESYNEFLLSFDLQHRLRRLMFLRRRINALYLLGQAAKAQIANVSGKSLQDLEAMLPDVRDDLRGELRDTKGRLSSILVQLRSLGRHLRTPDSSPLSPDLLGLNLKRSQLSDLLDLDWEAGRRAKAQEIFFPLRSGFGKIAEDLSRSLRDGVVFSGKVWLENYYGTEKASQRLAEALDPRGATTPAGRWAREILGRYACRFDDFDVVAFPMLYGTDAGETDTIEIVRIAPEDAKSIIDERRSGFRERKTRGWKYAHFGAFLSEDWRRNDILFGRLDAAEVLINTFVPECNPDRETLRLAAQRAIIEEGEGLTDGQRAEILRTLSDEPEDTDVVRLFKEKYRVPEDLSAGAALPFLARGVSVTGKILDGLSRGHGAAKALTRWFARIGSWLAGIVSLSLIRIVLLFLLGAQVVMVGTGWLFHEPRVIRVGILALMFTVTARIVLGLLAGFIRGGHWPVRALRVVLYLVAVAILIAAAAGIGHGRTDLSQYKDDILSLFHHGERTEQSP